jgi:hypothetical protein
VAEMGFPPNGDFSPTSTHSSQKYFPSSRGEGVEVVVAIFLFNLVIFLWSSLCLLYKDLLAFYWLRFGNNASDYIKIKTNISFTPFSVSATPHFAFRHFNRDGLPYLPRYAATANYSQGCIL